MLEADYGPRRVENLHEMTIIKQFGLLFFVTVMALAIRLWSLKCNPFWYSDEGTLINIAWNTIQGHPRLFGMTYTFSARAPLSSLLVGAMLKLFGKDILVLRCVSAVFGGLSVFVLGLIGGDVFSKQIGVMAAAFYAILPLSILFSRWGFADYNMLTFMLTVTCLIFLRYFKKNTQNYLVAGSLVYSATILTNYLAISLLPALLLAFLVYDIRRIVNVSKFLGLTAVFPAIFVCIMLVTAKEAFLFSVGEVWVRLVGPSQSYLSNVIAFLFYDGIGNEVMTDSFWIPIGLSGVFILSMYRDRLCRILGLFAASISLCTLRIYVIQGPHIHGVTHTYPYIALGFVMFVYSLYRGLQKVFKTRPSRLLVIGVMLIITVGYAGQMAWHDYLNVTSMYRTNLDKLCLSSSVDAYNVADWVNNHTCASDLVIASPQFSWLLRSNLTGLMQATSAAGYSTVFYPNVPPAFMFVFNSSYVDAKYMIYDSIIETDRRYHPNVCKIVDYIVENWEPVYRIGEFTVYRNPLVE